MCRQVRGCKPPEQLDAYSMEYIENFFRPSMVAIYRRSSIVNAGQIPKLSIAAHYPCPGPTFPASVA